MHSEEIRLTNIDDDFWEQSVLPSVMKLNSFCANNSNSTFVMLRRHFDEAFTKFTVKDSRWKTLQIHKT